MTGNKLTGREGEIVARAHLEGMGWRVMDMNWRCPAGEIDIVAEDSVAQCIVFVEVKARRGSAHGAPSEAVDARKRRKLIAAAESWLGVRAAGGEEPACRFDIAEVFMGVDGLSRVVLRRGAFDGS